MEQQEKTSGKVLFETLREQFKKIIPKKRKGHLFFVDDRPMKKHEFDKGLKKYKDEIGAELAKFISKERGDE